MIKKIKKNNTKDNTKDNNNINNINENKNIFLSFYLNKLILKKGKFSKVDYLINNLYLILSKKLRKDPILIIKQAVSNVMPLFLIKNRKKVGKKKIVIMKPFFILNPFVRNLIGLKWIVEFSLKKSGVLLDNLIFEIIERSEERV
jgi:ribosomal protein S7